MNRRYLTLLFCSATLAHAEGFDPVPVHAEGFNPAPVKMGFIDLTPILSVKEAYDSNLYRKANNEEESWVQALMLGMNAVAHDGPHEYSLNYNGEAGFFENSSADNYIDNAATLDGKWEANSRHRFELTGGYRQDHDRRGTEYFQGDQAQLIDEPARFHESMFDGRYSYGADQARGRLDLEVKGTDKTYTNFRELTEQNDFSKVYGTATFLWRLAGELRGLLEATQGEIDYRKDPVEQTGILDTRDSNFASYFTGVTWDLAGKTTGTLKIGRASKDFDDADRKDFSGASWTGEVSWNPRSYSTFTVFTGRRAEESYGRGDYRDVTNWGITWTHKWSDRIASGLYYEQSDEKYKADPQHRDDTFHRYRFSLDYVLRRWATIGMFYTRDQRTSNLAQFDYPRDYTGLILQASL